MPKISGPPFERLQPRRALERARRHRDRGAGQDDPAVHQPALEQVHRRRPDEAGDEHVDRLMVERLRRVDLLEHPVLQHRDPVAHGQGLGLIVGHVDRRDAQLSLQARDFGAHLHPKLGVQVRQRLVHQEGRRFAHHRAPHGDPLPLPAGQRPRACCRATRAAEGSSRSR